MLFRFVVLKDLDFWVEAGELVTLVSPSGGGKTTLLNILGGLTTADQGVVEVAGQDLSKLDEDGRAGCVVGIHTHDDAGVAVAGALAAVEAGVRQVQGCVNGFGERTGNANLLTLIADLELKTGWRALPGDDIEHAHRAVDRKSVV